MTTFSSFIRLGAVLAGVVLIGAQALAGTIAIPSGPLFTGAAVQPLVMLDITKDQNLNKKAYDDYSDLNNDGWAETTYDHTIDYYGYFDSYKCYSYSSADGYFSPIANSLSVDASSGALIKPSDCSSWKGWHGNFLNWITMSRMDTVRKLLYGGARSTDTASATILERTFIPMDAHSWAKYYNPYIAKILDVFPAHKSTLDQRYPSISKLTPYTSATETPVAVTSTSTVSFGGTQASPSVKTFKVGGDKSKFSYGDQVLIEKAGDPGRYMIGAVSCVANSGVNMFNIAGVSNSGSCGNTSPNEEIKVVVEKSVNSANATESVSNWNIYNFTQSGISACNTTPEPSGGTASSQTSTATPKMRVAQGNFSLWSANERWQCAWREDGFSENTGALGGTSVNGNRASLSGIWASAIGPNKTTSSNGRIKNGVLDSASQGPDYIVRVKACASEVLIGGEKCAKYPDGNYKPIGMLQYYGESGLLKFGMMTGSYNKNKSGGVLRKNISNISDEINGTTDGSFKTTIPSTGSIIQTLSKMRIWGYYYGDGTYAKDGTGGNVFCTYGQTNITEGQCLSWGNPMSEVYLESIRYLAGKSATTAFSVANDALGLKSPTWVDPLSKENYCAPLNVLVFNSAANTYEHDSQMSGSSDIGKSGDTCDAAEWTDKIGAQESINGKSWFVGNDWFVDSNNVTQKSDPADLCSSKNVSNFSDVFGICPEGAGTEGTYLMTGVAYFAHTNPIRDPAPLEVSAANIDKTLRVSTYGIALATNTPKRTVSVNGSPVTIMPQGRLVNSNGVGGGSLVDWKIACEIPTSVTDAAVIENVSRVSAGRCNAAGTGAFYWNEEDSEQGGDYDQDMWGRVQYAILSGGKIAVTTDVVAESTSSAYKFGFGYAISGTTKDGPHFHSGINGFSLTDSNAAPVTGDDLSGITSNSCSNCQLSSLPTTATYTASSSAANTVLQDPLWYAAKFGGFTDDSKDPTGKPDQTSKWDTVDANGVAGSDGVPDNFFLVTNPNNLENALDKAFVGMLGDSSASSVATNSTSLQTGSRIYQARFNTNDWSGQLRALNLDELTGDVDDNAAWDGGQTVNTSTRKIITYGVDTSPKQGIPFTWSAITDQTASTTQRDALNSNGLGTADSSTNLRGSYRVDYLRGSQAKEGTSATNFRPRPTSRLGDIVDSSPSYVGSPSSGWAGAKYKSFRVDYDKRTPILYVGANDGMLHAFKAEDGTELLGYIPSVFYNNDATKSSLSQLANQSYSHKFFVDGTPMTNDIEIGSDTTLEWKTVLAGGLNWGGRAYYALDVTDPDGAHDSKLAFSEANAKSLIMWEFSNANDSDLGYTFTQPTYPAFKGTAQQIVKMRNGKWALVVGNGYNSESGTATLFIFFLDRSKDANGVYSSSWVLGTDYIKLVADKQLSSDFNGLATPMPFSARGDGIADWIFAGDLRGNVWKFDVSDSDPANWKVAYNASSCGGSATVSSSCTPLFTAADSAGKLQPITTAPMVTRHPNGGVMVLFGTGKYLESADTTTPFSTQTFYGVWDNGSNNASNTTRSKLLQQKVVGTASVSNNANLYRVVTDYCIVSGSMSSFDMAANIAMGACNDDWSSSSAKKGWYMDLPDTGERIAYNALLRNDRIVFPTLIPSTIQCDGGGDSWLMELDALTGRMLSVSPFDMNLDGNFDGADNGALTFNSKSTNAGGIKPSEGGIFTTPTVIKDKVDSNKEYKYASTSKGAVVKTPESVTQGQSGRISWREIVQ